jgi:NADH dehydrogenase
MILVAGGTGLVGAKVVQTLLAQQVPVRVLARGLSDWASSSMPQLRRIGVEVVVGEVLEEDIVRQAVEGCDAIVHAAGVLKATPGTTTRGINVDGMRNLVELGQQAGVQRFIYVSCLGASEHSQCDYFASKWEAEKILRASRFYWTIFRPGLIYGDNSQMQRIFEFLVTRAPFVPIIGSGLNRISPVSAADVAACVAQSIYDRDSVGKSYELVGSGEHDLVTLLTAASQGTGTAKGTLSIPTGLAIWLADWIAKLNPKAPIDGDVMRIITHDLTGNTKAAEASFKLQFAPYKLDSVAPAITDGN